MEGYGVMSLQGWTRKAEQAGVRTSGAGDDDRVGGGVPLVCPREARGAGR